MLFHEALARRRTIREIAARPLAEAAVLPGAPKGPSLRFIPQAAHRRFESCARISNSQEIDLYVALESGVYLYEAVTPRLAPVATGDLRALAMNSRQSWIVGKRIVRARPALRSGVRRPCTDYFERNSWSCISAQDCPRRTSVLPAIESVISSMGMLLSVSDGYADMGSSRADFNWEVANASGASTTSAIPETDRGAGGYRADHLPAS